jgi:hypothetical protein
MIRRILIRSPQQQDSRPRNSPQPSRINAPAINYSSQPAKQGLKEFLKKFKATSCHKTGLSNSKQLFIKLCLLLLINASIMQLKAKTSSTNNLPTTISGSKETHPSPITKKLSQLTFLTSKTPFGPLPPSEAACPIYTQTSETRAQETFLNSSQANIFPPSAKLS